MLPPTFWAILAPVEKVPPARLMKPTLFVPPAPLPKVTALTGLTNVPPAMFIMVYWLALFMKMPKLLLAPVRSSVPPVPIVRELV